VLSKSEIENRLPATDGDGGEIFRFGTWDPDSLRGAAYDLRVATDYLIVPNGTRYWPEGPDRYKSRQAPFTLGPGDVAFVSSVEELCMPFDLSANIAPQFRRALDGILVMSGFLVDPGYEGRLHFQLANVGDKYFEIIPEETSIAAVQFLPLVGERPADRDRVPSNNRLLLSLFHADAKDDPLPPLAFFGLKSDTDRLAREFDESRITLAAMKRSTDQLLVFGVFLVAITLIGVSVAALISVLAA
jgi:deoxycytidine triphosphate deaminase